MARQLCDPQAVRFRAGRGYRRGPTFSVPDENVAPARHVHGHKDTGPPELEHDHLQVRLSLQAGLHRQRYSCICTWTRTGNLLHVVSLSELQFSEDILRRAKKPGITSPAFSYLTLSSARFK